MSGSCKELDNNNAPTNPEVSMECPPPDCRELPRSSHVDNSCASVAPQDMYWPRSSHGDGTTEHDEGTTKHDAGTTKHGDGTTRHEDGTTEHSVSTTKHGGGTTKHGDGTTEHRLLQTNCESQNFGNHDLENQTNGDTLSEDMGAMQDTPVRQHRGGSCESIHRDHYLRHHRNSPGVDSLEVASLTHDLTPDMRSGMLNFASSTPRDRTESVTSRCSSAPCDRAGSTCGSELIPGEELKMPIVGYEVMEQRAKFTVFKVQVVKNPYESWFIFRRYTDFVRLNDKLKLQFPYFRLALPPKRWFSDNFDPDFLEDRVLGLQAFINNISGHRDILNSKSVIAFFCLEDPPGPHDSLEESRAMCESLEEGLYRVKQEMREKDATIELLKEELSMQAAQIDHLNKSLRVERSVHSRRVSPTSQKSECSLPENDQEPLLSAEDGIAQADIEKKTVPG